MKLLLFKVERRDKDFVIVETIPGTYEQTTVATIICRMIMDTTINAIKSNKEIDPSSAILNVTTDNRKGVIFLGPYDASVIITEKSEYYKECEDGNTDVVLRIVNKCFDDAIEDIKANMTSLGVVPGSEESKMVEKVIEELSTRTVDNDIKATGFFGVRGEA